MALGSISAGIAPAGAVDWQVLYHLSETLRASDNIRLRAEPEGAGFSSNTSGGLDIAAFTPTSEWRTTGDIGHLIFFGEGIPEQRKRTIMSATSRLLKRMIRTDFNLNAHFRIAPATATVFTGPVLVVPVPTDPDPIDPVPIEPIPIDPVLPDPTLADLEIELLNFDRISYGASAALAHQLTRIDNLALSFSANRVDFTGDAPNVTPHSTVALAAHWARLLTRRLNGSANASVNYFQAEDESERQRLRYNVGLGATFRASHRLTASANAGLSITDQRQTIMGVDQSDVSVGFNGILSLSYTPWRDTAVTVSLSQFTSPDSLGNLRSGQAARGSLSYQINELSSINLTGAFSNSSAAGNGGDSRQTWTISPTYSHALTRSWNLALTYQWIKSDTAQSNSAFLTLSHNGTILP